jgi:hypothetical protein
MTPFKAGEKEKRRKKHNQGYGTSQKKRKIKAG